MSDEDEALSLRRLSGAISRARVAFGIEQQNMIAFAQACLDFSKRQEDATQDELDSLCMELAGLLTVELTRDANGSAYPWH